MDPDVFEKWPVRTETRETRGFDAMGMSATKYGPITCYSLLQPWDKIDKMSGFY